MIWETARPARSSGLSDPSRSVSGAYRRWIMKLRSSRPPQARSCRPEGGKDRVSGALVVPRVDGQLGQAPADVALPVGEQPRHLDLGIERPLDRLGQQVHLVAEEVDEQIASTPAFAAIARIVAP